jgi:hypothetical protein
MSWCFRHWQQLRAAAQTERQPVHQLNREEAMTRMTRLLDRNHLFEVAVIHHTQCGTGFLADPDFRHQASEATGVPDAELEASAVADPYASVMADIELLLASPGSRRR